MFASIWAFHALRRRRLWAAHHGSALPLAALLAFAALRSPGATLLTVPLPPALGELVSAASGAVSNPAGLSQYVSEHTQQYIASSLWPSWLPLLGPGARGQRSGVKTRSGGGGGDSSSSGGAFDSRPSPRAGPRGRRQPQATSPSSRHAGGSGKRGGNGSGDSSPAAAAGSPGGPGAAALLPLPLGARQLLAAMAAPPLLSLVSKVPKSPLEDILKCFCRCRRCSGLCMLHTQQPCQLLPDAKAPADG